MRPDHPSDPPLAEVTTALGPVSVADGGAGPAVLALHGAPGSHRDFRWLGGALGDGLRLIRPDLPGFGATPLATLPARAAVDRAPIVPAILDALGVDRCVLVGHSLGATLAVAAASRFPDRVAAMALLASPGLRPHRVYRAVAPRLVSRLLDHRVTRALVRPLLPPVFAFAGFPRSLDPPMLANTLHCFAATDFHAMGEQLRSSVPTLVAWAADDPMIEPAVSIQLAAAAPAGPRLAFDDGGHNIQKTRAVEIAAALIPFVRAALDPEPTPQPGGSP